MEDTSARVIGVFGRRWALLSGFLNLPCHRLRDRDGEGARKAARILWSLFNGTGLEGLIRIDGNQFKGFHMQTMGVIQLSSRWF